MKGKKILKIFGIILAVLLILMFVHTIRNYIIITGLQNKFSSYANSTNYHIKSVITDKEGKIKTLDYYKQDTREFLGLKDDSNKLSIYNNGERKDVFIESQNSKTAQLDSDSMITINIYNGLETKNSWQTLIGSIFATVRTTQNDGKDYYVISGFMSPSILNLKGAKNYIEKETGLLVKIEDAELIQKEYEFDQIDNSIFIEPDIGQYQLKS